jgi:hypothetical protein
MDLGTCESEANLTGRELTVWLESPEGEAWSRANHLHADRHSHGVFGEIKDDHPAACPGDGSDIETANRWGLEIQTEITWCGMNSLPQESPEAWATTG